MRSPNSMELVRDPFYFDEESRAVSDHDLRLIEKIIEQIQTVYDPEIPVNIYDLGLIYDIDIVDRTARIEMTLTAPGCPVAGEMPGWVADAVEMVDEIDVAEVTLTFSPPWDISRMSDEARLQLNLL